MIFSHQKAKEGETFKLSVHGDTITLDYDVIFCDMEEKGSVSFSIYDTRGKVIQADLVNFSDRGELKIHELYHIADFSLDGIDARFYPRPLCRLSVSEDGTDSIMHIFGNVSDSGGVEMVERTWQQNIVVFLSEKSPFYASKFEEFKKKKKITDSTDIRDSLAYLDAQVDALTRIVLALVPDDSEARRILARAEEASILDIKSEEKLLAEFEHKQKVREAQKAFYEK